MNPQDGMFIPHARTASEVLASLRASPAGLTSADAEERRARYGANLLPEPRPSSVTKIYLGQFKSPLVYLLLIASGISLGAGEAVDAAFVFVVLQLNAAMGTFQEWRGMSRSRALQKMISVWALVLRDGSQRRCPAADVVPGDVMLLEPGMRVPADARLLEAQDLTVDESLLSGESAPVGKIANAEVPNDTPVADRVTMVYAGTTVLAGRATAVLTHTGLRTELGRIAGTLRETPELPPPLVQQMAALTRGIAVATVGLCVAVTLGEFLRGGALAEVLLFGVALAVSAVPEGLPIAITVALSVATGRMARRNVIVRHLAAVEGLGACTLIASDKTGTLTLNELTVRKVWLPELGDLTVQGSGYSLAGGVDLASADAHARMKAFADAACQCGEAHIEQLPDGSLRHSGDTVDVAFLILARKVGGAVHRMARGERIPYEPARRFGAVFHPEGTSWRASVKGAAETVLPMCAGAQAADATAVGERLAREGFRVLAVASGILSTPDLSALRGLTLLGIAGLLDPLRPEAAAAVAECRAAGLSVAMVTGDHPLTALAIARQLGIADGDAAVRTGRELATVQGAQFDAAVASARVFARVEPLQKQAIVAALQRAGHTVAVTGDGVNDAPALHTADIGVAMGRNGTDVARDAGDLVLADDNFASVVAGVEEGRVAYDNIRKVVWLLLSTGVAEIALFLLALTFGLPLPLSGVQLLWLNLVTNGVQDVTLALERSEPDIMRRPPRPRAARILDRRMIGEVVVSGAIGGILALVVFKVCLDFGWGVAEAGGATLLFLVLFENVQVLICRSETRSLFQVPLLANPWVVAGVAAAQALHIGAMHVAPLAALLDIQPLPLGVWGWLTGAALLVVPITEGYKAVLRLRVRAAPVMSAP